MTRWFWKHAYDLAGRGRIPYCRIGDFISFDPQKVMLWPADHEIAV